MPTAWQAIDAGALILGENYIQEARDKFNALYDRPVQWHFIGHLQSNKAKYAVRMFDLIHSVDSLKLAKALDKEARKNGKVQDILIQVNISREETKSGIDETEAVDLVTQISGLENVQVKGLMTMPPFFDQPEKARPFSDGWPGCGTGSLSATSRREHGGIVHGHDRRFRGGHRRRRHPGPHRHRHFRSPPMKLLMHICCGPCSIYPVQVLRDDHCHEVMGFFYRNNIHPFTECMRREETLKPTRNPSR
jgi:hypothetical protein